MLKRRQPTADEKVANLLLRVWELEGHPIDRETAKAMSADQIASLVVWDHAVYHVWEGSMHPTNLTAMLIGDHRTKTRRDLKIIAKVKRATRPRKRKGLPIPGSKDSPWRKRMNGKAERR